MQPNSLSVVIPVVNEENSVQILINRVLQQWVVGEVLVIDDASTDNSAALIRAIPDERIRVISQKSNKGKGAAVSIGLSLASKPFVLIQDADLEYDPNEYQTLLAPLVDGRADVVYGSRFLTSSSRRVLYFWHRAGNNFLTLLSNIFTNIDLTDMETCFKIMTLRVAKSIHIQEKRFGIEPEMTAQIAAMKVRIFEVPISYNGRTYEEGKKITWKDGFSALRCIIYYNSPSKKRSYLKSYQG